MRIPFVWTRPSQTLQVLCACCAFWGVPASALAVQAVPATIAPTAAGPTTAPAGATSTASESVDHVGSVVFYKRVLVLVAVGGVVGLVASWVWAGPSDIRLRLLNKPKKTQLTVLVPPGPAPRLIPSESPNATRARPARAPAPRQTPASATGSGITHYIAAFAESSETSEAARVDYLLVSEDAAAEPPDSSDGSDAPLWDAE